MLETLTCSPSWVHLSCSFLPPHLEEGHISSNSYGLNYSCLWCAGMGERSRQPGLSSPLMVIIAPSEQPALPCLQPWGPPAFCWGFPGFHHLLERESKQGLTSIILEPSSLAEVKSSSRNSPVAGMITWVWSLVLHLSEPESSPEGLCPLCVP